MDHRPEVQDMLSARAHEILEYIQRFTREKGFPPTIREIGGAFRISSTNGVRYYLSILEKAGHLKRRGKISRGIEGLRPPPREQGIPILGRVAAGQPTLAEESFEGRLESSELFGDPNGLFALRVRGDSMTGAGMLENDYVIVRHQDHASPGEIIVALLEDEATVKYYQPRRDRVELVAANPDYPPRVVTPDARFRILGIVKGVVRIV
jgi:repressor LexA